MRISVSKLLLLCLLAVGAAYGVKFLRGAYPIGGSSEKRREIDRLERENEILQRQIAARKAYLGRLEQNPDELKLEIERRLKLLPPDAKEFILQDGTSEPPRDVPARQPVQ